MSQANYCKQLQTESWKLSIKVGCNNCSNIKRKLILVTHFAHSAYVYDLQHASSIKVTVFNTNYHLICPIQYRLAFCVSETEQTDLHTSCQLYVKTWQVSITLINKVILLD